MIESDEHKMLCRNGMYIMREANVPDVRPQHSPDDDEWTEIIKLIDANLNQCRLRGAEERTLQRIRALCIQYREVWRLSMHPEDVTRPTTILHVAQCVLAFCVLRAAYPGTIPSENGGESGHHTRYQLRRWC